MKENKDSNIDFVILWVDGNDPAWRKEKAKYSSKKDISDDRDFKYRDWDNLQFWFRGIEKYAPWVRTVHFVTWGHLPAWLNTEHPKLHIVNHNDYMDHDDLPCFNSEALEICIHRIPGLAEHFVYFNDDMFLLKDVEPTDFFQNDLPCDSAIMNVHCCELDIGGTLCNFLNIGIINRHFTMKDVLKNDWKKWFNLKYGLNMLRNIYLLPCPRFPGMLMQHLPNSYNKSVFEELWNLEPNILKETAHQKFRSLQDVNQWLFKEWQLASGGFVPRSCRKLGTSLLVRDTDVACNIIENQRYKMLSYNDEDISYEEFMVAKEKIKSSFEKIFPEKSLFEK